MITAQDIVNALNDALRTDPDAVRTLFATLVPCNEAMLNHPSIVCWSADETGDVDRVGFLGLLNGILSPLGDHVIGRRVEDEDMANAGAIIEFVLVPKESRS